MEPCQLVQHQGEVPGGIALRPLGLSVKTIKETSEIFFFLTWVHQWNLAVTSCPGTGRLLTLQGVALTT